MVLKWGCDDETTPWGFTGQFASQHLLLLDRDRHQAGLHLPGPQLRAPPSTPTSGSPSSPTPTPLCSSPSSTCGSRKAPGTRSTSPPTPSAWTRSRPTSWARRDGIPKTPEWASKKCGVPEWTIKALAREFGQEDAPRSSTTSAARWSAAPTPTSPAGSSASCSACRAWAAPACTSAQIVLLRHAARRGARELSASSTRRPAASGLRKPVPEQRRRLGHADHPQDADPGGHPQQRAARLLAAPAAQNAADRGPVHRLHSIPIPKEEGGTEHPHDLDRHPLPHHLLEPRQLDHRSPPRRQHRVSSSRSTRGWRTTASTPTSSCRRTPPWRWRTSSPTSAQGPPSRPACCRRRPSSPSASPRATTRSCSPSPRSWAWRSRSPRA